MESLTNNLRKTYASLSTSKGRKEHGMYMAQGTKCVADTLPHFTLEALLATEPWMEAHSEICSKYGAAIVRKADIKAITTLTTPPEVIAIYRTPQIREPEIDGNLTLALDGVQDPGNMGTIIRVADWMGVRDIVASIDTVDVWSPKVVQATMGAISRVKVYYTDLADFLARHTTMHIYGTALDGEDIYSARLEQCGIIVMGNEGQGIRPDTYRHIHERLYIPPYPAGASTSESLNVAVATAITLAEFRRRTYHNK